MNTRIYHPDLDRYVDVPASAVQIHRVSGWIPADEAPGEPVDPNPATDVVASPVEDKPARTRRGENKE